MLKAIILSNQQLEDIAQNKLDRFELVKDLEWVVNLDCHCWQYSDVIFKDLKTNLIYKGRIGRCGYIDEHKLSFSDWEYESELMGVESTSYIPVKAVKYTKEKYVYTDEIFSKSLRTEFITVDDDS